MEEPTVLTHMFMTHAMNDSLRGLAFDNRCNPGEIVHRAIQEYTCPPKKEELAAINNNTFSQLLRRDIERDIERLGIPFEDLPPQEKVVRDRVMRTLHLSSADFNKVANCARKMGLSRQVIFTDIIQKHLDKNPRTP